VNIAEAVFTILNVYISTLEVFPEDGAVPPCHFGVTAEPSI
jgi:hypothetical protein